MRLALVTALGLSVLVAPVRAEAQRCEFPGVLVVLDRSASMTGRRRWPSSFSHASRRRRTPAPWWR